MKKTLIALTALVSVAPAAELVAEWKDFSSLTSGSYTLDISGNTKVENGILSVVGSNPPSAKINITDAGLSINEGFTLNITLNNVSTWGGSQPHSFVGIKGANTDFLVLAGLHGDSETQNAKFAFNGSANNVNMSYPEGTNGSLSSVTGTENFYTITLTYTQSAFTMYLNGELWATGTPNSGMTDTMAAQTITSIAFGSWAGNSGNGTLKEDIASFAIYKGAMTASEVAALVPEPTTATLSLLALAGLAARRRRK